MSLLKHGLHAAVLLELNWLWSCMQAVVMTSEDDSEIDSDLSEELDSLTDGSSKDISADLSDDDLPG